VVVSVVSMVTTNQAVPLPLAVVDMNDRLVCLAVVVVHEQIDEPEDAVALM
jgi:hypothetical protein